MSDFTPTGRAFTGRRTPDARCRMLAIMLAFFGTIIAVNLTMPFFATSSFGGLVVGNGINDDLDDEAERILLDD